VKIINLIEKKKKKIWVYFVEMMFMKNNFFIHKLFLYISIQHWIFLIVRPVLGNSSAKFSTHLAIVF
jgi:hypothetical protein